MKPKRSIVFTDSVTHPNPLSDPGNVDRSAHPLIGFKGPASRLSILRFFLSAPPTESVTLNVYAVDETTLDADFLPDANTIYYPLAANLVVTGSMPPVSIEDLEDLGGLFYLQQVTDTLTEARTMHIIEA